MPDSELSHVIRSQIDDIFKKSDATEQSREVSEQEARYNMCAEIIRDGIAAIKKIPEFRTKAFENYFKDEPHKPITISIGPTEFTIWHQKVSTPNVAVEQLSLTRDGQRRLMVKTNIALGTKNGEIIYSEDPEDFMIERYPLGHPLVFEEAQRMIKELQLASK